MKILNESVKLDSVHRAGDTLILAVMQEDQGPSEPITMSVKEGLDLARLIHDAVVREC